jgi:hypothetical protein
MQARDLQTSGFFTHAETGLCLAPRGGKGESGGDVVFTDDVERADADFRFVSASETRARTQVRIPESLKKPKFCNSTRSLTQI